MKSNSLIQTIPLELKRRGELFYLHPKIVILFENQNYPLSRALMSEKLQWRFSACYLEIR